MGPPKTPTPNRPSSLNKENIPYSPEKVSYLFVSQYEGKIIEDIETI